MLMWVAGTDIFPVIEWLFSADFKELVWGVSYGAEIKKHYFPND
jgi:hypothetical protein